MNITVKNIQCYADYVAARGEGDYLECIPFSATICVEDKPVAVAFATGEPVDTLIFPITPGDEVVVEAMKDFLRKKYGFDPNGNEEEKSYFAHPLEILFEDISDRNDNFVRVPLLKT
jgi:hypothetical protein